MLSKALSGKSPVHGCALIPWVFSVKTIALSFLLFSHVGISLAEEFSLPDEFQLHGFLTQGLFNSSGNNIFGQSDSGISLGQTEIGINASYQLNDRLRFAAQGLYRRAGDVDPGSLRLDYGLVDFTLFSDDSSTVGLRGGRVKTPYGLYNETRDVAFTHPTIMLPQGIYFDRSRALMLASDGVGFYAQQRTSFGDFNLKINYGMAQNDFSEIKTIVLAAPDARGKFDSEPSFAAQLSYEINGGEYIFAVSYLDQEFQYTALPGEFSFGGKLPIGNSTTHIHPLLFSAQYNGEDFTLTGEYSYRWNDFGNFHPFGGGKFITESWYLEASYRIMPKLQATVRYDTITIDKDDRAGDGAAFLGFPRSTNYAKDWVFALRYDITPSWMVRAEYQLVHGTAWLMQADNPVPGDNVQDWDLYGLQLSFKY